MVMFERRVRSQRVDAAMPDFAAATWRLLEAGDGVEPPGFDAGTLDALPPPAQRLLASAVPVCSPLHSIVSLEMSGAIRIGGRWLPFTAVQILRAGTGFVWAPFVGGRFIRFTGADALGPDGARIEFRFHNRIPVVRGSGPEVERSAAGRLAAETVAWLPQRLTPQAGASWEAIDETRAAVILPSVGADVRVEVSVDEEGEIGWLGLQRWRDSAKPPTYASFGGSVDSNHVSPTGVRIAGGGTVGWDWQTPQQPAGEFFRYRIINARFATAGSSFAAPYVNTATTGNNNSL